MFFHKELTRKNVLELPLKVSRPRDHGHFELEMKISVQRQILMPQYYFYFYYGLNCTKYIISELFSTYSQNPANFKSNLRPKICVENKIFPNLIQNMIHESQGGEGWVPLKFEFQEKGSFLSFSACHKNSLKF